MNNMQATTKSPGTRALGNYAIRRANKSDVVKFKFHRHMLEKRRLLANFNPFEHYVHRSKAKQGAKNDGKDRNKDLQKLKEVTKESQDIILSARSVFPISLFPDTINVDRHKLTIIYKTFFWTVQTISVPIADIKNIQADLGPFLGSLTITSDHFINNTQMINNLWRNDVKCIQELVQGAMVAKKESIDITKVKTGELKGLLTDLGKGHSGATA